MPAPPRLFIHLHIPKTAGSWARQHLLEPNFDPDAVLWADRGARGLPALIRAIRSKRRAGHERVLVTGHLAFGLHRFVALPCTYLVLLREPVERAASEYYFVRDVRVQGRPHPDHALAKRLDFASFTKRPAYRDVQSRMLAGLGWHALSARRRGGPIETALRRRSHATLRRPDVVVGVQENLEAFRDALTGRAGLTRATDGPTINTTPYRPRGVHLEREHRAAVQTHHRLDLALYREAVRRLTA
ncbi:MAG: hypothetical protein AAGE65_03690 [Planctomycetota bacterium]